MNYLGRLGGLYAKKNRFNSVATTTKQNYANNKVQNSSLIFEVYLSPLTLSSVSTKIVGMTNPTAVPTILTTVSNANANDL